MRRREAPLRPCLVPARSPPRRRLPLRGGLRPPAGAGGSGLALPQRPPDARLPSLPSHRPPRARSRWRPGAHPVTSCLALRPLRLALDPRDCYRLGSLSPAASHSQGADPDRRDHAAQSREWEGGYERPWASCKPTPHLPGPGRTCAIKSLNAQARVPESYLKNSHFNLWVRANR